MIATKTDRLGAGPVAAYITLCIVWGSTYLAIRLAVQTIPPLLMVGVRSVVAGGLLTAFALARGNRLASVRTLLPLSVASLLLFVGGQAMLAVGETRVESGQAAVIGAMQALAMPLAAWALGAGRSPPGVAWLGLLVGFGGVVALMNPGVHAADPVGLGIVLFSVVAWSFGGAVAARWPAGPVALVSGLQMIIGGLGCLAVGYGTGGWHGFSVAQVSVRSAEGFFYLIALGSLVGFSAFAWLVQIWPAARLSTYTYVNPVVALALGAWLGGEVLTMREVLATGLILGAVAIVMAAGRNAARIERERVFDS